MQKIETHNHPVVLYGAGHNAKARFHELTSEIPNIVCFCDRDESKYGTLYCGLPVFSWEETVARYPDCLIYVTAVVDGDRKEIASRLTSLGVSGERLLNVGTELKRRVSCLQLEQSITFSPGSADGVIAFCCSCFGENPVSKIPFGDSVAQTYERVEFVREAIIAGLQHPNHMKTCCSGCSRLSEELWFSRRKISFIILGLSAPCNFKCIYCNAHDGMMIDKWKEKMKQAIELLEYYDAQGLIDGETEIQFVTGEIGVAPDRERILSILAKCRSSILSNCSVYVERIAEMLRSGRSRIVVSIDAGTRSAFQKIRGVDLFDQVRANVARYIESGNVILKYILLIGVNDDDENLKGFVDFCHEVGGFQVVLSRDTRDMGNVATERPLLSAISRFAGALQEKGITVGVRQREFTAQEYEKIQAQIPSVIGTLPRE